MARQEGTPGKHVIEDFSQPTINPTTRDAVAATNPIVSSVMSPERVAASKAAAERHIADVQAQLQEQPQGHKTVPPSFESDPQAQTVSEQSPPPTLQSDLSLLATAGKIEDETVVAGYTFKMHTLTVMENNEVLAAVSQTAHELAKLGHLRIAVLSRAIDSVNGAPLESLHKGPPGDIQQIREQTLGSWQMSMVTRLFDAYTTMLERSEAVFGEALESDAVKN